MVSPNMLLLETFGAVCKAEEESSSALSMEVLAIINEKTGGTNAPKEDQQDAFGPNDSSIRYAAYAGRFGVISRSILSAVSKLRYMGYTGDIINKRKHCSGCWKANFY